MQKERKNKVYFLNGFIVILLGIVIGTIPFLIKETNKNIEEEKIDNFFEEENSKKVVTSKTNVLSEEKAEQNPIEKNYSMIIEIPKINLKKGLYDIKSKYNSVKYNIQIIKESKMPDVQNSSLILASHNGNSKISFFDKLDHLQKGDKVFIYYKNIKYIYQIVNNYEIEKNGTAIIRRDKNKNVIAMITCKKNSKTKQLVFIGNLIAKENY